MRRALLPLLALLLAPLAPLAGAGQALAADPVRVFAAGSLAGVMPRLIEGAGIGPADAVFGPAGTLAERLRGGEAADLFASSDTKGPDSVLVGRSGTTVPFARNRMCLLSPAKLGITATNALERMLTPDLRLVASTPGTDPSGDYARSVFARAETVQPGSEATLIGKALLLIGAAAQPPASGRNPLTALVTDDRADLVLHYCSATDVAAKEAPGLASLPLPDSLEVSPVYGLALLSSRPEAAKLALFMMSQQGQALLAGAGLRPIAGR